MYSLHVNISFWLGGLFGAKEEEETSREHLLKHMMTQVNNNDNTHAHKSGNINKFPLLNFKKKIFLLLIEAINQILIY